MATAARRSEPAAFAALARRLLADARVRNLSFAALFGLYALLSPISYRHSFPTLGDRLTFAHSFGANKAARLFYGVPHDLLTAGGYTAWRQGFFAIVAGLWGVFAAVRALRAEEDAGRQELVLAGVLTRGRAFAAALLATGAGAALIWLGLVLGLAAGGLAIGPSAYLALATVSPAVVFAGLGAVACQLAPTRRLALEGTSAVLGVALVLRVVADTSAGLSALRWTTPLGWAEEARAFAGPRPAVLLLPLAATVASVAVAGWIAARRDVGEGLLTARDSAAPRYRLLSSPTAQALRGERGSLLGWLVGIGFFALIVGMISDTFSSATISTSLQQRLKEVGGVSVTTPEGALSFYFLFFALAISLFACAQIAAIRREEAEQQLETLLALPVGRRAWLGGRLALATAAGAGLALAAGALTWVGARSQGVHVSLLDLLGAGANCLPVALLFLALGALVFAAVPRAGAGVAYALVGVSFVWETFGGLLGAPEWTQALSPFHHFGLVPAQPFKALAAAIMLAVAALATAAALSRFRRRDLTGT